MDFDINKPGTYSECPSVFDDHKAKVRAAIQSHWNEELECRAELVSLNFHPEHEPLFALCEMEKEVFSILSHAPELYFSNCSEFWRCAKKLKQRICVHTRYLRRIDSESWTTPSARDYALRWCNLSAALKAALRARKENAGMDLLLNILESLALLTRSFQTWLANCIEEEALILAKSREKGYRFVDSHH